MSFFLDTCCDCGGEAPPPYDDCSCTSDASGCPDTYCGCAKISTKSLSVTGNNSLDFGDQPPGVYYGAYCSGMGATASNAGGSSTVDCGALGEVTVSCCGAPFVYGISSGGIAGGSCPALVWSYQATCIEGCTPYAPCFDDEPMTVSQPCTGTALKAVPSVPSSFNPFDVEAAMAGQVTIMAHAGGGIELNFSDCPLTDNGGGDTNFSLYGCPATPKLVLAGVCATWIMIGEHAQVVFTIENRNCICWNQITASLAVSGGGSSNPSADQANVALVSYTTDTTDITFTFDATNVGVTATLTLSSPMFTAAGIGSGTITFSAFLAPIFTVTIARDSTPNGSCGPRVNYTLTNSGNWAVSMSSMTISNTNGYGQAGVGCAADNPFVVALSGEIGCGFLFGESITATVELATGSGGSTTSSISDITDGTIDYGSASPGSITF